MTTLHDRLGALAEEAPTELPDGLWERGRRYRRRRALAAYAGGVVAVLIVALFGIGAAGVADRLEEAPAGPADDVPFADLHLPRTLYAPDPWTDGTDEAGPPGPLAVIALAERARLDGWNDVVTDPWYSFGISAVDGSARFLDLPGNNPSESDVQPVLSPDGRKVGYVLRNPAGDPLGWAVYDTMTGTVLRLTDPEAPRPVTRFDLAFSGDSRYLLATYSPWSSRRQSRAHQYVAWDVETGDPTVLERPGHYWIPNVGLAPHSVVWSRGQVTYVYDPAAAETREVTMPLQVVTASFGPGGRDFAYVGHRDVPEGKPSRWRLFVGSDAEAASLREVTGLDFEPGRLLGWRDPSTVVVSDYRGPAVYVDVRTGEDRPTGAEISGNWSTYASDLWANELVPGTPPPDIWDPRWRIRVASCGVLLIPVLVWVLERRRRVRP